MRLRDGRRAAPAFALALLALASGRARADGFQLERYEPAAAGSWFLGVEDPWYSSTRWFAAALVVDYAHQPLLAGIYHSDGSFDRTVVVVDHALVGHLDLAGSLFDRVQVQASLPVVLDADGEAYGGIAVHGAALGDPRVGALVRLWGHAERDAFSVHVGGYLWIPVGDTSQLAGESTTRGGPMVVLAGRVKERVRWTLQTMVLLRKVTSVGDGPASSLGSELQVRAGVGVGDKAGRFQIGPEAWLSTMFTGDDALSTKTTSLELLLGGQVRIARVVQLGAGVGTGVVPALGTPDLRVLGSVAYAPEPPPPVRDRDGDGVPDAEDLCPDEGAGAHADPKLRGCPVRDADGDGVPDAEDLCPSEQPGAHPDAGRPGCPVRDADGDGVPDAEDLCPSVQPGAHPDPKRTGCPDRDLDRDGVPEGEDLCPSEPSGAHPDPKRPGCPDADLDRDGVPEGEDLCPSDTAGAHPDPKRTGCPAPDLDGDGVPDAEDACPNLAGPASPDRAKSGCPEVQSAGSRTTLRAVHFATAEAVILPDGFPVLDEAAALLAAQPDARVVIEGHADDTGTADFNLKLSRRRAEAVVRYLVEHGVPHRRLRAVGYGDTRPLGSDRSDEGRARNRRVEMLVPEKAGARP